MTSLIESTETIVFLDFAFRKQDLELLKSTSQTNIKRIFAITRGLSKNDCKTIQRI